LFNPRDEDAAVLGQFGAGAIAAQLSHDQMLPDPRPFVVSRFNSLAERYHQWRERISLDLGQLDLVPDLAQDIGSKRWFRGAFTMFALAALALLFWPDFSALEAAPMHLDQAERDEFRSQMIMPLALGADSGRHMAATSAVIPLQAAPERPSIELIATLSQGDSFARMLQRAGVGAGEIGNVTSLVASAMPLGEIEPGTRVDITLGRRAAADQPRPLDKLSFRARFDLSLGLERRGGALALDPHPIRVDATPLRIRGTIGDSIYRSARAAGAPAKAVQDYLRTLNDQMDLDALSADDQFDMIVAYKRAATGETQVGDLLYAGVEHGGKAKAQLMRWGKDGQFFEASGVGEQKSGLVLPVADRGITSGFGMRFHPILGYSRLHAGVDLRASYGEPIHAVAAGTVTFAGRHGGHGNFVRLDHGGGFGTGYAHMSRIAVNVGDRVRQGQIIGFVGSTGLSTGPHLHYEMYRNGKTINPMSVRFATKAQLSGRELADFRARLGQLLDVAPGAALASLVPTSDEMKAPEREIDRADHPREIH
jgi:murein DD-endopeptidase MepM/ murein hydrolase activator NlpD